MRHIKQQNKQARGTGVGWQRWALNIGAVLGSLCLTAAALTLVLGLKPLIFASGSMGPGIPTGSLGLAIATPAADVVPGQVVSVVSSDGTRVTHRVVSADPRTGLVLKGDANTVADLQPYTAQIVDRVFFSVPGLGYVAGFLGQPWVYFLGGLLCALLVYIAFFRKDADPGTPGPDAGDDAGLVGPEEGRADWGRYSSLSVPAQAPARAFRPGGRRPARAMPRAVAVLVALALVVPAGLSVRAEPTRAAFVGKADAHTAVSAARLLPATSVKCNQTSDKEVVDIKWDAPAAGLVPAMGYRISVLVGGKSNSETLGASVRTETLSIKDGNGLLGAVLGLLVDILSLLLPYSYPVTVSVVALYPNGWESAPATYGTLVAANKGVLLGGKTLTC
ncbi:MAG: hypothetical protein WBX27_14170 [Specibacter sp.]